MYIINWVGCQWWWLLHQGYSNPARHYPLACRCSSALPLLPVPSLPLLPSRVSLSLETGPTEDSGKTHGVFRTFGGKNHVKPWTSVSLLHRSIPSKGKRHDLEKTSTLPIHPEMPEPFALFLSRIRTLLPDSVKLPDPVWKFDPSDPIT